ncbi:MAG: AMP-binding protein [Trueperaceae bacterium]|nr:AMP-binding protein [Trueperaceae bacterium]
MNATGPFLDLAARRAELTPHRPAVHWRGAWIDYATLDARAERLAGRLHAEGVRKGDRVSILAHNHLAHLDLILATPKAGFVYAPFNTRLADAEQRALADDLRPSLLLHDDAHAAGAAATGLRRVPLASYDAWLGDPPPAPRPDLGPEDPQMILLTGGTTGLPKGAVQPYRQGLANAENTVLSWGLRDSDCCVQATPCFHAAVNALTLPLLHLGGRVALLERFDPSAYLARIRDADATLMFLVPTMYRAVIDDPGFAETDFGRIRWAISGGAPCPEPVRAAFAARGVRFKQGYGLSEAGVNCFAIDLDDADAHPDAVGVPVLRGAAAVRRADGTPCEDDEVGELTLAGPHLFSGYFERPDATAEVLRDGWLWTGDLATRDAAGRYRIVGRRKEMFISGGENVYPAEIERALARHPGVSECAVVGVPDDRWGEVGLAAVVPDAGVAELDAETLRAWLQERIARYKVPKHVRIVDALPKSGAGKIVKARLAGLLEEAPE